MTNAANSPLDLHLGAHIALSIAWALTPPRRSPPRPARLDAPPLDAPPLDAPPLDAPLFVLSVASFAWWLDLHHQRAAEPTSWLSLGALVALAAWRARP